MIGIFDKLLPLSTDCCYIDIEMDCWQSKRADCNLSSMFAFQLIKIVMWWLLMALLVDYLAIKDILDIL